MNLSLTTTDLLQLERTNVQQLLRVLHDGYYHTPTARDRSRIGNHPNPSHPTPLLLVPQMTQIYLMDGSQYVNHSEQPLMDRPHYMAGETLTDEVWFATRDIEIGEELTAHYGHFASLDVMPDWLQELERKHCPGETRREWWYKR